MWKLFYRSKKLSRLKKLRYWRFVCLCILFLFLPAAAITSGSSAIAISYENAVNMKTPPKYRKKIPDGAKIIPYVAYPKQNIFHASDSSETVYGGAKGGGKSCALVMDSVAYGLKFKGAKIYLFRKTFDELEANLIDELFKRIPEKTKDYPQGLFTYDRGRHVAYLEGGSRMFFRYIRNVKDARKYAGREMDYCGVDELTQHEEESIQILQSCMRSPKGFPTRFKGTCNPGDIGHAWVKKRYIDATAYGKKYAKDKVTGNKIIFIPAKVTDNKALMDNDPTYIKRLQNLPPTLKKAFLDGNWDIFENQAFDDWRADVHICKHFEIPGHWKRWISADNGYTDPFAWYWFAVSPDGAVHIYREYTREYGDPKVMYSDQARKVVELSKYKETNEKGQREEFQEKIDFIIVGHDAFQHQAATKTPDNPRGKSIADYYRDGGLTGVVSAITDRKLRKAVWHEYLKVYEDENTHTERAKVVIHDCCTKLIETIPQQVLDPDDIEKYAETDYDHWVDGAGYGLVSRHAQRSKNPKEEESRISKHKKRMASKQSMKRCS